jgi:hypothetical protein
MQLSGFSDSRVGRWRRGATNASYRRNSPEGEKSADEEIWSTGERVLEVPAFVLVRSAGD